MYPYVPTVKGFLHENQLSWYLCQPWGGSHKDNVYKSLKLFAPCYSQTWIFSDLGFPTVFYHGSMDGLVEAAVRRQFISARRPSRDSRYAAFLCTHCAYTLFSHMCYNRYPPTCGFKSLVPDGRIQGRWTQKWPSKISCGLGSQRPRKRPNSKFPNCGLILTIIFKNWPKNV
jgi:hypothetical protein